ALTWVWRGKIEKATDPLRAALTKEKDAKSREDYLRGYFDAMLVAGKPLAAYTAAPDAKMAFRLMAAELRNKYRQDDLRELVGLHKHLQPDDNLLPFYRGALAVEEEEYEQADKAFAAGMAKPPDEATLALFRASRVQARYYRDQALAAYAEIG